MITEEQLNVLSQKFQIDTYSVLREYLQLLFLKCFYEIKGTDRIYFKGGTAIHFLFHSFRFSEDLDFTSVPEAGEIKDLLKRTMARFSQEAPSAALDRVRSGPQSCTGVIRYEYGLKHPLTIRLDFSLRERPITKKASPLENDYPIGAYPLVVHLDVEELMAEKVRALLTRQKGRDLFDLWFLLTKNVAIREDYVRQKMKWYQKDYAASELLSAIERFPQKELESDLGKFLPRNYRPFLKELKEKTLEKLRRPI